jgi:hypothetical protein
MPVRHSTFGADEYLPQRPVLAHQFVTPDLIRGLPSCGRRKKEDGYRIKSGMTKKELVPLRESAGENRRMFPMFALAMSSPENRSECRARTAVWRRVDAGFMPSLYLFSAL